MPQLQLLRTEVGVGLGVNFGTLTKWTLNYNAAQHVSFKTWDVVGDFIIEFDYYINAAAVGVHIMIFGDIRHPDYYSLYYAGHEHPSYHLKIGSPDVSENILMSYSPIADELLETRTVRRCVIKRINNVLSCTIDCTLVMQCAFRGTLGVNRIGGGTRSGSMMHNWIGQITNVKLTDLTNNENSRYYKSIISSRDMPESKFLIDDLCKWRKSDWVPRLHNRAIKIPTWIAKKNGDSISFTFVLFSLETGAFSHLVHGDHENWIAFNHDKDRSLVMHFKNGISSPIEINNTLYGYSQFKPQLNVEYRCTVRFDAGNFVNLFGNDFSADAGIDGVIYDIEIKSASDARHYPCNIKSSAQPTISTMVDIVGGINGEIVSAALESKKMTVQQKGIWTNALSTDGEITGFEEDSTWTELK